MGWFLFWQWYGTFVCSIASGLVLEPTHPSVQRILWPKRPGLEVYHSPSSGTAVKNEWCCTCTVPYFMMA